MTHLTEGRRSRIYVDPPHSSGPLALNAGVTEVAKWLALLCMVADHVNKYLFDGMLPGVYAAGRLAMPLFGFVLAYNLARPDAVASERNRRTIARLCAAGLVSTPAFIALIALVGWWPLNIMFTLALSAVIIWLIEARSKRRRWAAVGLFLIGGAFVEFWWPAVALCVSAWWFCKLPTWRRALLVVIACASLSVVNGLSNAVVNGVAVVVVRPNHWALASFPVVLLLTRIRARIPRLRLFFYVFYPMHLLVLWFAARHL